MGHVLGTVLLCQRLFFSLLEGLGTPFHTSPGRQLFGKLASIFRKHQRRDVVDASSMINHPDLRSKHQGGEVEHGGTPYQLNKRHPDPQHPLVDPEECGGPTLRDDLRPWGRRTSRRSDLQRQRSKRHAGSFSGWRVSF